MATLMTKHNWLIVLALCASLVSSGCGKSEPVIAKDFSTPQGAILKIEDAYRDKDVEAAVACKDFHTEARLMLESKEFFGDERIPDDVVAKTAEVLELAYRQQCKELGFPDMTGVTSSFPKTETREDGIVIVTEKCHYPDGGLSLQRVLVCKTADGWRVLNPLD